MYSMVVDLTVAEAYHKLHKLAFMVSKMGMECDFTKYKDYFDVLITDKEKAKEFLQKNPFMAEHVKDMDEWKSISP